MPVAAHTTWARPLRLGLDGRFFGPAADPRAWPAERDLVDCMSVLILSLAERLDRRSICSVARDVEEQLIPMFGKLSWNAV